MDVLLGLFLLHKCTTTTTATTTATTTSSEADQSCMQSSVHVHVHVPVVIGVQRDDVVVVTGANSGIGFASAERCAQAGAQVILGCRDENKCQKACELIRCSTGNVNVSSFQLNLSDINSIESFARKIDTCNVLINNAGEMKSHYEVNHQLDLESTLVSNFIGPYMLTKLLLPILSQSSTQQKRVSKVLFVSSRLEKYADNLSHVQTLQSINGKENFDTFKAYSNAKLLLLIMTYQLSKQHKPKDTGDAEDYPFVSFNSVSPGVVHTNLAKYMPLWQQYVTYPFRVSFLRSPNQAADSILSALKHESATGKYFFDGQEITTSVQSHDSALALFAESEVNVACSHWLTKRRK